MTFKRWIHCGLAILALAGCSTNWKTDYERGMLPEVTRDWRLVDVVAVVPDELRVNNNNTFAPSGDIVWHGEPFGDRKAQVAAIVDDGITSGAQGLNGPREVTITARVLRFHGVTPSAVARAPAAVHNITYEMRVFDAKTGQPLTGTHLIRADLEALVGASAIAAAINGNTQRNRIVAHIAAVTRGWLGFGPDQRREFGSIGR